ncbi:MAG: hypothetical protein UR56_C0001G0022 [Candidatus Roizmanbacteria bacterium GW2011_GWC2_34_23]|uniref:Uncharacterized protein n=1 Tax=Candidatus Roizmanbacteria bacterium GW2011_GWC2_34_23 TaxID=1618484 RepID=A0A0G0DJE2_9BACT|nr:MAG: hypothetical protein UR56_C0001G0022 [Candidatus Roizmanbacteria bacterium GW2011_GWC2_34_23]
MKLAYIDNLYQVPRVRVELTSGVFQTSAVTTLAISAKKICAPGWDRTIDLVFIRHAL